MDLVAALGLAGLLFIKEAGVPIPIPGDLLVIGAGVATAGNPIGALGLLLVILVAGYAGGAIQFLLARGALRRTRRSPDPRGCAARAHRDTRRAPAPGRRT